MPMSDALRGTREVIEATREFVGSLSEATSSRSGRGGRRVPAGVDSRTARKAIREVIDAFSTIKFRVDVPGSHYGGVSNQELFGYLAESGREFLAITPQLNAFIKARLQQEHLSDTVIPLRLDLEATRQEAVVEFIQARMLQKVRDVRIRRILAETIARKRKAGYSNPALPGYATGDLYNSLNRLRVVETR